MTQRTHVSTFTVLGPVGELHKTCLFSCAYCWIFYYFADGGCRCGCYQANLQVKFCSGTDRIALSLELSSRQLVRATEMTAAEPFFSNEHLIDFLMKLRYQIVSHNSNLV